MEHHSHLEDERVPISFPVEAVVADDRPADAFATRKTLGFGFWLSIAWLVAIILAAVLAPILPIPDPGVDLGADVGLRDSPNAESWFGTDALGRDVFSRVIWGARISLVVGFAAIAFGMLVGGSLGMLSGFLRGWFDRIAGFVFLVLLSFPALILAILITALLDRNLLTICLVLGVLGVAPVGRLSRAATIQFAEREFVMAAHTIGAKRGRILVRELLPNVVIPMGALALLGMAVAIVAEGGLAFLGLSLEGDTITWGKLIADGSGRREIEDAPWVAFAPIIFLFLTVLSLNYAGDKVREYFDVKEISV